ncbi:MAG: MFS transporter [Planctomycetaceae bacterium]|nr:MFS transporter [Planctomycetaceae bacterium]
MANPQVEEFPSPDPRQLPSRKRYVVMTAICLAATIAYMGRNCLGVASEHVQADLEIDEIQMGWAMTAFFLAYSLAQVPAGWLGNHFGPRAMLSIYATIWSFFCAAFYFVGGAWSLIALQVGFGIAQAGIFPCSAGMIRHWMPATRWALAVGLMGSFMSIGGALGSAVTGYAIEGITTGWLTTPAIPWQWVFVLFALPGLPFVAWFYLWFRNQPEEHPGVNTVERELIRRSSPERPSRSAGTSWIVTAVHPGMLPLYAQQFCRGAGYIFFSTWFPKYLRETRNVTTGESGLLTALPLLSVVVGCVASGLLVDFLWKKTGSKRISRQLTSVLALATCAACIGAAYFVADAVGAVALISLGTFCGTLAGPPSSATAIDKAGEHTEQVYGVMNMVGNMGAAVCPMAVAWMAVSTGQWEPVLLLFVGIYAVAAVAWMFLDPRGLVASDQPVV